MAESSKLFALFDGNFKMIEENDKFGVVLILPEVSFSAELSRISISEIMKDIDDKLTEQGAPEESDTRCAMVMDNALMISSMIAHQEVEHGSGVADVAYSFVYAFAKSAGFEKIDDIRGLTGSFVRDKPILNPCLGEIDFQTQATFLTRKMEEHESRLDDVWDYDISFPPTLN